MGKAFGSWRHQQEMYESDMEAQMRAFSERDKCGPLTGRPMKDITPKEKPEPAVKRVTKMSD